MTACIRGCVRRGRHLADCDPHAECGHLVARDRDACTEPTCPGCEPREARHGQLCDPCHRRMREWFGDGENSIQAALGHLTSRIYGGVPGVDYDRQPHASDDGPPVPLNMTAYDARQLLMDRVFIYEERVREVFDLSAPDTMFDPAPALRFLNAWLTKIEDEAPSDLLFEMWGRLAESMSEAHAIAPWRAAVQRCKGIECPECGTMKLVIYGGEDVVTCRGCGEVYDRADYDRWAHLIAWEHQQEGAV